MALVLMAVLGSKAAAQNPWGGRAPHALVIDYGTGQVLFERNADVPLPPASMSKLVTLEMLFEALEQGRVGMDTRWRVSERAYRMGGSRMFLELRDRPTTEDLIRGIAVLSGNDAAVVVAEGLFGSEEAFARAATERMRTMGLVSTTIANASGWPHPEHRMSLRDLATLARYMIDTFPQYYRYLSEPSFTWNGITQQNRLPLIDAGLGVDGLKTGHTSEAGYGLTGSAVQGDRRVIFVFSGLESAQERAQEAEQIINWYFRSFTERRLFEPGAVIGQAEVWLGAQRQVDLVAATPVRVLVPHLAPQAQLSARIEYEGPIPAPVVVGQEVARLVVTLPQGGALVFPLQAAHSVPEGGFYTRLRAAALILGERLGLFSL